MRRTKDVLALVAGVGICLSMAATAHAQATNGPPTVTASRNPTGNVRVHVPIAFTATASDPDGDTLTYLWDFGDGTTSTEQNPTKTYTTSSFQARTIRVTVDDGKGGTASATLSVLVQANRGPNTPAAVPQAGFAPLTVTFTGEPSDPDGPTHLPIAYSWDFDGDGTEDSTATNPTQTYTTPGIYSPRLRATDAHGGVTNRTYSINVLSEARDPSAHFRVLVFSKTAGFRHSSIDEGITALKLLGSQNGFQVDASEESAMFTDAVLAKYDAVVFLSTTGDVLNDAQQAAFERYIRSGRGYAGIHSATDTEYAWPWYGQLTGGYFRNHPNGTPTATVVNEDPDHVSTSHLPLRWTRVDEWYNYQTPVNPNPGGGGTDITVSGVHVLLSVDESTYAEADGTDGVDDPHPISWCKRYDGGRMWYTGMGHTEASFVDADFMKHILAGLEIAAGVSSDPVCGGNQRNVPADVGGTVPATLSLTVGPPASFGAFKPGVADDYLTSLSASVISTGADAALTVVDPSTNAPGRLVNGAFALASPVEAKVGAAAFEPVSDSPLALKSYSAPVSNDQLTIDLQQSIGSNDPLRTGTYSKTLVFTLSTTNP
jgi:cytochrome c